MIACELAPPLRVLALDTGRMNVLDLAAVRALRDALREAEDDPATRAIVLHGREDAFCAGLDNRALAAGDAGALLSETGGLLIALYASRLPIVAACRGHAVAAGAMLLLVADRRLAAGGRYRVGFSEVASGLALPRLPVLLAQDRLDRRRLQEATLLGRLFGPEEACAVGFLDRCVSAEALDAEACAEAGRLAELPPGAYEESVASVRGATLAAMRDSL